MTFRGVVGVCMWWGGPYGVCLWKHKAVGETFLNMWGLRRGIVPGFVSGMIAGMEILPLRKGILSFPWLQGIGMHGESYMFSYMCFDLWLLYLRNIMLDFTGTFSVTSYSIVYYWISSVKKSHDC